MIGFIKGAIVCMFVVATMGYCGYTAMAAEQDNMKKQVSDYCRVYGAECDRRISKSAN